MATITKRGYTYRIRASLGYDSNGDQIIKSTTWKPAPGMTPKQIEKEAERQAVLFEEKCKTGCFIESNIKFADFAELWFKNYADKQLKAKTLARYNELMKRVNLAIGHIKLEKIQPHHLLTFYENLREKGIREDYKYICIIDFRKLLKEKGYSKIKLSKEANISVAVIDSITSNKTISHKSAEKISKTLDNDINKMFKISDDNKTLSDKTILHYHRLISSILASAVQWQVIFNNPCERVKPPKVEKKEAKYLDDKQAIELLKCLENEKIQYKTIITLLLYTGMRRGELCGLKWSDIDFKNNIISIRRSSLYLPERGVFEDTTKNYSSERVIKISNECLKVLKEHLLNQNLEHKKLGDLWINDNMVFTQWNGKAIHPDTITNWFKDFVKKSNLPDISIHSLRHTNATLLIANGTDLRTVSKRLGHSNMTTTGNIYTHAIKSADEIAADALGDILNFNNKKSKA